MKLFETLSQQDLIDITQNKPVSFFKYIDTEVYDLTSIIGVLCGEYFLNHSGNKQISVGYERLLNLNLEPDVINSMIGKEISNRYAYKWDEILRTTFSEYDPMVEYEHTEDKTGNNTEDITYNNTKRNTGNNDNKTTFDTSVDDDGNTNTKEETSRSIDTNNDVYGFNSSTPVGDTTSNEVVNETIVGDKNFNTTHNTQTKTGTELKEFTIDESEAHTGNDNKTFGIDESVHRSGRNKSAVLLMKDNVNFWSNIDLFKTFFMDIDRVVTLPIYV